jgi:hypothetical protein
MTWDGAEPNAMDSDRSRGVLAAKAIDGLMDSQSERSYGEDWV